MRARAGLCALLALAALVVAARDVLAAPPKRRRALPAVNRITAAVAIGRERSVGIPLDVVRVPRSRFWATLFGGPPIVASASTTAGVLFLRAPQSDRVLLRAGKFKMGSDEFEVMRALAYCLADKTLGPCDEEAFSREYAPHDVTLDAFWLDRREVTNARYDRCVEAGPCTAIAYGDGAERFSAPEKPAVLVTWHEAATFCRWDGGRLPTEAEWERAARGLEGRRFPWGNVFNTLLANHGRGLRGDVDGIDGWLETAPVGSFALGQSAEGIEDLAGNVEEWVADSFVAMYSPAPLVNPQGPPTTELRVVRGGSYATGRTAMRAAYRSADAPSRRSPSRGFRCARDA